MRKHCVESTPGTARNHPRSVAHAEKADRRTDRQTAQDLALAAWAFALGDK